MSKTTGNREMVSLFCQFGRSLKRFGGQKLASQLTLAQLDALRFVQERQTVHMKSLSKFLGITPPSATSLAQTLVDHGLLHRHDSPADRRAVYISLTAKGTKILTQAVNDRSKSLARLLSNLNGSEQLRLMALLKKMIKNN